MESSADISKIKGLSEEAAYKRLQADGYNELPSSKKRNVFKIILEVIREPMFILLIASGSIYLFLGDKEEAFMLLGFVFVVLGITIYQENKTEKALDALKNLSSPRALVIRDGVQKRIAGREVVKDDIIVVKEGDRVPADAVLIWSINLSADESLLTGESVPVRKVVDDDQQNTRPGGDDLPFIFSGSLIVQGQGIARVFATGMQTEMGKIGKALQEIENEETNLQKETRKLVKVIAVIAFCLTALIVAVYGFVHGEWLNGVLAGITLAMAMLPEEFPVVLTIFLALGAWRISKKDVLTRRIMAVEILGAATFLCVDKTGTLTQNKMSVSKIFSKGEFYEVPRKNKGILPDSFHELIEFGILASKKDPFDPMEKALKELGDIGLKETEHLHPEWPFVEEYPLSKELLALSHVWKSQGHEYTVAAKGAPEAIIDLCHMGVKEKEDVLKNVQILAAQGLRVLGVAKSNFTKTKLPISQHDFDFDFLGLIGLADPIRETVPPAIKECYKAGIRVVMITGDYPVTAQNIAHQIGLHNPELVITGQELEKMTPAELKERIKKTNIFARVVPEQKLLIVEALKSHGEVVGMTGDGVNDAPALKASNIGIAMGGRGTDVARESADIVLLNDDFSSIVSAVRLGRRIFDNLKKAMAYIISVHIPIAGASLLPVLFNWPTILYPVHIVFLELIIDPACSIVFEMEPEEENIMERKPRNPKEPLFGNKMLILSAIQGVFALGVVIFVFYISQKMGHNINDARALAFMTLIISNLCLIFTNRSWSSSFITLLKKPNKAFKWVSVGALLFLIITLYVPFFERVFKFGTIHLHDLPIAAALGIGSILWFEFLKRFMAKKHKVLLKG